MPDNARPKVLLSGPLQYAKKELYEQIGSIADIVELTSKSRQEFKSDLATKYQNLSVIYHLHDPEDALGQLDDEFFSWLPKSCKHICHFGAGYDDVDVTAAYKHGISVTHTPGAVDDATATTAVYLILSAIRHFYHAEKNCRAGQWKKGLPLARDPEGKTLGIVGMGGIGGVVARRMQLGWGMKVVYYNRKPIEPKPDFECEYMSSLEELLKVSDVVSLHMPLNSQTAKSFSTAQFAAMKPSSVLVNTARGGVIDEDALLVALRAKDSKLWGVGLDVFPNEPEINPALMEFDNVTLLPHMGTETTDSRHKMGMVVINNISNALKGEPLTNQVPEQKKLISEGK
ncbi:hypothetical protein QFC22_006599 [Naganishia vaughanmartiniae]|uniref:Uncharacterized protein n=1 Tax=Naganishia vaughanmartiniae TaxID=1424756 RepID=A0ACC2WJ75_9TREE|nr:hypothetical protein QFC22_006599 [Naganishia vaughanmartiniae]